MFEFGDVEMTMNPVGRSLSNDDRDLVKEYLKNGGTITQCKDGETSYEPGVNINQWGNRKPKQKKDLE